MHFKDAKTILSAQNGMNLYRGCLHGCIYCDSRSECYRMSHDFEDVEVKRNAPGLLRLALRKKRRPCMIATGSMSDPYHPLEARLGLTRQCMKMMEEEAEVARVVCFGMGLTLRSGSREYFYQKLDEHFPGRKRRYQARYGLDYVLPSDREEERMALFHERCQRASMLHDNNAIFDFLNRWKEPSPYEQLSLF